MPPSTYYHDKAKYDGKIDQCETDIHDMTDKNLNNLTERKEKWMTTF